MERCPGREDDRNLFSDQIRRQGWQPVELVLGPAVFNRYVLALDITCLLQALAKRLPTLSQPLGCYGTENPDHRHRWLLRAPRRRPHDCAAERGYEFAPLRLIAMRHPSGSCPRNRRDATNALLARSWRSLLAPPSFEATARSFEMEPIAAPVHNDAEIEAVITSLGREPGGGLIAMPDGFTFVHRAPIILLAARSNVPAVYWNSIIARDGGLLSYGPDNADILRRAAPYVDRILRGAKPAELLSSFQSNRAGDLSYTAKALGLDVPLQLQQRADEIIE